MGWGGIARLCLVNAAIGGMAALPLNLFNRLMTVELALPALLPGLLVALHYAVQITRPAWGHRSDRTGARVPVILSGMAVLGAGVVAAAWAVGLPTGAALAVWLAAYTAIGLGIGAAGTSFLALLATAAPDDKRGAAATLAWLMLIAGAILASVGVGLALEPYSPARLVLVVGAAALVAFGLTVLATWRMDDRPSAAPPASVPLRAALRAVWADSSARRFTGFVFLSILAFHLSELIFEPFTGHVHGLPPDKSTTLSGAKDGAALLGMLAAGGLAHFRIGTLRAWAMTGCVVSALGLVALGAGAPLVPATLTLGLGNGLFVVGAIGSMMRLAASRASAEGTTMGVFGAAQAIAAGLAVVAATATLDLLRTVLPDPTAYGTLFVLEALLFLGAALMAARVLGSAPAAPTAIPGE
ncbi:MFS transporter [Jannaschia seohaensis]|uniref:BCD family chlorophyll transporter-like MFS transporter n=1 Tax=Jannaschia seohaensis TaxID=475081 RepID=A0A2Y9A0B5_9RHOB|nr:MFS transporter [Jannaschia seohaensis]PWJ21713.1 BCD family chlorophyll transporter-like MFS transporter [Jannaschia seohaensis]SSA37991.1 MFS transporter, BCD family, chlorophyll transporter [Jannaschia seohaensis]